MLQLKSLLIVWPLEKGQEKQVMTVLTFPHRALLCKWHSGNFLRLSLTSLARLDTRDCQLLPRNGLLLKVIVYYIQLKGGL